MKRTDRGRSNEENEKTSTYAHYGTWCLPSPLGRKKDKHKSKGNENVCKNCTFLLLACSPAYEFFSRTFGCGASKGTFGVYDARRDPGQAPWRCSGHSTSLRWLIFQGVAFRLVEPSIIGVNGKPHNFVVFQQPAALSVFFYPLRSVARATTSAQLVSPLLLPATTELHTASNSNSSSTSLEHHTYPLHLAL